MANCVTRTTMKLPKADHYIPIICSAAAPYIKWIAEGIKKAEGRINRELYQNMKVDETLCLQTKRDYVLCKILYKHSYKSFEEMLRNEGLNNMLPAAKTIEEGVHIYESFPGAERVHELGVVAIGLQPLESRYKK